jgi:hypothetical protein
VEACVAAFEQVRCDELIMIPCSSDPNKVGLLAEALKCERYEREADARNLLSQNCSIQSSIERSLWP